MLERVWARARTLSGGRETAAGEPTVGGEGRAAV